MPHPAKAPKPPQTSAECHQPPVPFWVLVLVLVEAAVSEEAALLLNPTRRGRRQFVGVVGTMARCQAAVTLVTRVTWLDRVEFHAVLASP